MTIAMETRIVQVEGLQSLNQLSFQATCEGHRTTYREYKALLDINPLLWGRAYQAAERWANEAVAGTPEDWADHFEWAVTDMTDGDDPLFWEERYPELWG